MDIAIDHPSFHRRHIALRPAGFFSGPKLLQNNAEVSGKKGRYEVRDDSDEARIVEIKGRFLDPLPKLTVDGEEVALGRPLTWYEYAWLGLPIFLVFAGGAIGGAFGFLAAYSSARLFRSDRTAVAKYALSGLISISAGVAYIIAVVMLQIALGQV